PRIWSHLPDVMGADRARFAGRRTLLVGSGYSAASAVCAWKDLADEAKGTELVWITRCTSEKPAAPLARLLDDPLPLRDQLARDVNGFIADRPEWLSHLVNCQIRSVRPSDAGY